jgi:hypothetical protein
MLQVGFAMIIFSYFSAILAAVTGLLSLLGGQVYTSLRLAICQPEHLELIKAMHLH